MTRQFGTRLHATASRRRKHLTDHTTIVNWILTLVAVSQVESRGELHAGGADVLVRRREVLVRKIEIFRASSSVRTRRPVPGMMRLHDSESATGSLCAGSRRSRESDYRCFVRRRSHVRQSLSQRMLDDSLLRV